jgi:hypothetical protein
MSTINASSNAATGALTINAVPDAPAAAVPAGFQQAVNAAISFFDTTFHPEHSVYLNIDFKYAPLSGGAVAETSSFLRQNSYSAIRDHLRATDAGIPADAGLFVPNGNPFNPFGLGDLWSTLSQQAVIGLPSPDSNPLNTNLDATITLNSNNAYSWNPSAGVGPNQFDAVSTLEHEISEVFGRQCGSNVPNGLRPEPFALFRYDRSVAIDTTHGIGDYFSINGGQTSIHNGMGEPGADLADWNSATSDCCGFAVRGMAQHFSTADVRVMEAMGWKT